MPTGSSVKIKDNYYIYLDTHGSSGNWELYLGKTYGTGIYGGSFDNLTITLTGTDVSTGDTHNVTVWNGSSEEVDMRDVDEQELASGKDSWIANGYYSYTMAASLGADSSWGTYANTCYVYRSVDPPSYNHYLYYNANGGTGAPGTQTVTNKTQSSFSATISNTKPTYSGYIFQGWADSASSTSSQYSPGSSYTFSSANKTIYAVWKVASNVYFNGTNMEEVYFNGTKMTEVWFNGTKYL